MASGNGLLRVHKHPLFFAAANGRYADVQRLVREEHMSPNEPDPENVSRDPPLMVCLADREMVRVLIRLGAEVNYRRPGTGLTPLHVCAKRGLVDSAMELVSAGADVNYLAALAPGPGEDKLSPFHVSTNGTPLESLYHVRERKSCMDGCMARRWSGTGGWRGSWGSLRPAGSNTRCHCIQLIVILSFVLCVTGGGPRRRHLVHFVASQP